MPARDPELQSFPYRIDLIAFAKHTGYELQARAGGDGLTLLEHPNRDRIVVARCPDGAWIYASANRHDPRGPDETPGEAARRLRDCIARTSDKGTIVEFVQARDWTARTQLVSLECVRERLRDYVREGMPLDFHGALCPPTGLPERSRRILQNSGGITHPSPGQALRQPNALDPCKEQLTKLLEQPRSDTTAPPRVLVITASPAHAALYYEQHGKRLGHTNANAVYTSVGAERPRGAGWDLSGIDKAMAAVPPGGAVVAALAGLPAGERLASELRALAARYPHVTFERHTLRMDRDRTLRGPDRAMAASRGR
jgi:hypothetical protein